MCSFAVQELRVELTYNVLKACHLFRCVDKGFISEEKIWLERIQCCPCCLRLIASPWTSPAGVRLAELMLVSRGAIVPTRAKKPP